MRNRIFFIGSSEKKTDNSKMNIRRYVMNMASASAESTSSYSHPDLSSMNKHNIVVGLNGALQKRFVLPTDKSLVPGNVHRAVHVDFGVGGKGQDVAIALDCLLGRENASDDNDGSSETHDNKSNTIRLVQFIGTGFAGDAVHNLLNDRLGKEAMEFTVRSSSEMRTCTSIVASDETTELVEPSGIISNDELEELFSVVSGDRKKQNESPRSICIMGSMPPGCPEDTYAKLYAHLAGPDTVCVVDSLAGIVPLLQTVSDSGNGDETAATSGPILFKMNASELCKLAGTSKSNSETDGIALSELISAIEEFLAKFLIGSREEDSGGVIGLAITDGKHDSYFVTIPKNCSQDDQVATSRPFDIFQLPVQNLERSRSQTLYPIGAGGKHGSKTTNFKWRRLFLSLTILKSKFLLCYST